MMQNNIILSDRPRMGGNPAEILDGIRRSVKEFVGDAPQFDDLTMLCVEYCGAETKS